MLLSVIDPQTGELLDPLEYSRRVEARTGRCRRGRPVVVTDIKPFRSPCDGTMVTSRRELVEHNARNGVEQIGNDASYRKATRPRRTLPSSIPYMRALYYEEAPLKKVPNAPEELPGNPVEL